MNKIKANALLMEYNDIFKENENIYRGLARRVGLSECAFWILYILRADNEAPVQSDICACLHLPKQTINSALKKMEAEGYLVLTRGSDLRSKRVSLTADGVRLCEKTVDRVIGVEQNALNGLPPEEQTLFLSLFRKYNNLLKNYMQEIK
ncbi:MAG: MarR family transcriptional regulator [Lachnospiraceae bacterium]|nr:MarR family transcriptional regulator [Lachnospiraceae bacterium]